MASATVSSVRENNLIVVRRVEWVAIATKEKKEKITFRERNEY